MAGSAGRKHLLGILRFANGTKSWRIKIVNDTSELTEDLISRDTTGFIGEVTPMILSKLKSNGIPSVIFGDPAEVHSKVDSHISFMSDDNEQIGTMGAKYLLSLGNFASFAFIPDKSNRPWSMARQSGFERHLKKAGVADKIHKPPTDGFIEWLKNLPKPAAVMAAYDFRAKEITDMCASAKIEIPRQIAVLGVDDDELICDYTQPSLSTVRINHEDFGYTAAEALHKLLSRRSSRTHELLIRHPADCITERESTRAIPPVTYLANKIHTFIKSHARDPITISDIVRHAGVSRRIADLRLKQSTGKTIHETMLDIRLSLVANYLRRSRLPINKISRLSGFQNVQRLKYIFKSRYGVSMREFRLQAKTLKSNPQS